MRVISNIKLPLLCIIAVASLLGAGGCSTTRRLPEGEILYTGVKPLKIQVPEGQKEAPGLGSQVKDAINVAPNNSLISPYYRYPFPLGLWVYNNWNDPGHGFKHWLYEKLVAEPVLISDVRPEVRVKMIDEILDNNGYFRGHADYELVQGKNKRKASIRYNITTGDAYPMDSIILLPDTCQLNHLIDSVAARSSYLQAGQRYCTDSLSAVRVRIANVLRNRGYYFFKPDYIEYLADSVMNPGNIAMKMTLASNMPQMARQRYVTGSITTMVNRRDGGGTPDTTDTRRGRIIVMEPSKLRREVITDNVTFRTGKTFSVRDMNRTQTYLSRLGIFDGIDIVALPDTTAAEPTLNVYIDCTFASPWQVGFEVNVASKSNDYLGPGAGITLTNRNVFGGGEFLNMSLNGSYEWETGHSHHNSAYNSYEVALSGTLSFPRLIAPKFVPRRRHAQNWTHVSLSGNLLNRPRYFMLGQIDASFGYDWQASRHVSNTLDVFKLSYTKLMHSTHDFDSIMARNPAVGESFKTQFIPQISYTYTYSRLVTPRNRVDFTFTVQEAGNLFWCAWKAFGVKNGDMKLLGIPFSQFVKGQAQLVYGRRLSAYDVWLVSRIAAGAEHAYGNNSVVPYSEQFWVGGANSVRAFTVRSLGPGSYRSPADQVNGYFDQTGTFMFQLNTELRFPIVGPLHGAVFLDSGNVWLLKNDPQRPGGKLEASSFLRDLALGTGVGLRVDIGMMVIRGDLGIGLHAPYDTGVRGYFNMPSFGKSLAFHLAIGYPF
ncbi:MAG: BamA/TamA family outer membrane protein [Candidatus Amulumruptor caecigallinarius]|nr:BamA/TamA family outer membrane protein [Candidatus Amulumruptor caecigallinarius]MCM1397407.1 BamA/TamA family outer membrane protein [Candidatus Amulumruptor caecigallinarius]MCM1454492.1 BamA/TamA family outer membrane protein [bacterium]